MLWVAGELESLGDPSDALLAYINSSFLGVHVLKAANGTQIFQLRSKTRCTHAHGAQRQQARGTAPGALSRARRLSVMRHTRALGSR